MSAITLPGDLREIVVGEAQGTPGAIGLLLVGSAARGGMDRNSDWDFICLVSDTAPWPKPYRDGGRETFPAPDGRQVELAFSSPRRLRTRMSEQADVGIIAVAEFLSEARAIWSVSPEVSKLCREARARRRRRPPALAEHELAWRCYEIWNQSKDIEDRLEDPLTAYYLSFLAYWNLVTLYFRLARRWLPRPKAVFSTIRDVDSEMYVRSKQYTHASSPRARYGALRQMMEVISQRFGVEFERYYTSPPTDTAQA